MKRFFIFLCCSYFGYAPVTFALQDKSPMSMRGITYRGFYAGIHGGVAIPNVNNHTWWDTGTWNNSYDIGTQLGYVYKNFRFEGEFSFFNHTLAQTSNLMIGILTFMGNVYYHFNFGNFFVPFVGAGIGWINASLDYNTQFVVNGPSQNSFAYQGIAGIGFPLGQKVGIDVSYHYLKWTQAAGNENIVQVGLNLFF